MEGAPTLEPVRPRGASLGPSSSPSSPQAALTRDLKAARDAYESGDIEQSRKAHAAKAASKAASPDKKGEGGGGLAEPGHDLADSSSARSALHAVYDGSLSTACILAATAAIGLPGVLVVSLAASLAVCSALARVLKEYRLRSVSIAHYDREKARESWELEHHPEGEKNEMVELYESKGLTPLQAKVAVEALSSCHSFFVDLMMSQELEMITPERPALPIAFLAGAAYLAGSSVVLLLAVAGSTALHFALSAITSTDAVASPFASKIFPFFVDLASKALPLAFVPFSPAAEVTFASHLVFVIQRLANNDAVSSALKLLPLLGASNAASGDPTAVATHRAGLFVLCSLLVSLLLVVWLGTAYLLRAAGDQLPSLQARRGLPPLRHARTFATQIGVCALLCAVMTNWLFVPVLSHTLAMATQAQ